MWTYLYKIYNVSCIEFADEWILLLIVCEDGMNEI